MPDSMRDMNIHRKHDYARGGFAPPTLMRDYGVMNIAMIRRARGLTQTDLAEMAGLTQPTVSRAEKGDDGVTLGNFKAIADALNVHLADLFGDGRTEAEQAVLDGYRQLPPDRQKGWQDILSVAMSR